MSLERLEEIKTEGLAELESLSDAQGFEDYRVKYFGKKGLLTELLKSLGALSKEERPAFGKAANEVKVLLQNKLQEKSGGSPQKASGKTMFDHSLPGKAYSKGRLHPVTQVMRQCIETFQKMGFDVKTGPDIEEDFYNFEALNIPHDHPARDMHDTFYLDGSRLLRTHTSPVQIREMEQSQPPMRFIAPGKVYRRDSDVTHLPMFHQIEGLMVDQQISFSDLKGVLSAFLQGTFGSETKVRFRPSFFPFTEPSAEIDISCIMCAGKGCRVCSGTTWLEIAGAGMVDPEVFKAVDLDPQKWRGFAFGLGIERIAMLTLGIDDIRLFYENDVRFLNQF